MKVFLDACVLYPPLVRALVLEAAGQGLFLPFWSPRVLEEWRRAIAAKQGMEAEDAALRARADMEARFPDASMDPDPDVEGGLRLPDPADTHVLASAIAAEADTLLTFNLRDLPRRALTPFGIEPRHPDGFLWERLGTDEQPMSLITGTVLRDAGVEPDRARAVLKRARLSRFGKAYEALSAGGQT